MATVATFVANFLLMLDIAGPSHSTFQIFSLNFLSFSHFLNWLSSDVFWLNFSLHVKIVEVENIYDLKFLVKTNFHKLYELYQVNFLLLANNLKVQWNSIITNSIITNTRLYQTKSPVPNENITKSINPAIITPGYNEQILAGPEVLVITEFDCVFIISYLKKSYNLVFWKPLLATILEKSVLRQL